MDTAKIFRASHLLAAGLLAAILLLPRISCAVGIGEVVRHSKLGQALFVQVELVTASGENVDASCLSLAAPDPRDDDAGSYLLNADIEIRTEGGRRYAVISSVRSLNEPFAKFRLQVQCFGTGSVVKTLTILPDLDTVSPIVIAAPAVPPLTGVPFAMAPLAMTSTIGLSAIAERAAAGNADAGAALDARHRQAVNAAQQAARSRIDNVARAPVGSAESALRSAPPARERQAQTTRRKPEPPTILRLRISAGPIDESRIGKISPEERELLLARQKLLDDADDQTSRYLALQHQVKQLQDELSSIKQNLALRDGSASSAPVAGTPGSAPAPTGARPIAAVGKAPLTAQQDNQMLQLGLLAAGLALVIAALVMLLRRHNRLKSLQAAKLPLWQANAEEKSTVVPVVSPRFDAPVPVASAVAVAASAEAEVVVASPIEVEVVVATPIEAEVIAAPSFDAAPPARMETPTFTLPASQITLDEEVRPRIVPEKASQETTEKDLMLEEAELFAVHGHPNKAIALLHEVNLQYPSFTEAWMLLISILSSLGRVEEFERAAQDFLKHNKNSESWKTVQTLGRMLDKNNPLYAVEDPLGAAAILPPQIALKKRRPVGHVLVEMGALSVKDMKNCLADFDPKVHGRFGDYLISRKIVTLAQLNQALQKQSFRAGLR